jgi:hypothetical protein
VPNEPDLDLAEARQLAADVFVMGFPLVLMDAVRRAHPIELNRILLLAEDSPTLAPGLADEGTREVRTSAWIDVSERPVVMHLPHMHGRYFSVTLMDATGDPFASLGSHTGDAAGSDLAIVGPRWRGELSGPLKAVRSVTDVVWALSRITASSDADRPEAEALAGRQALTPLHEAGEAARPIDRGPMRLLDPPAHTCVQQVMDMTPEMFTHRLNLLVERAAQGLRGAYWPTLRTRLRALNELGKPGEIGVDSELGRTLSKGFADGAAAIRAGAELAAKPGASGWRTFGAPPSPGAGPLARAVRVFTDLGGPVAEDVLSLVCDTDEAGRELSGAERYRIHFARGATPPVVAFWSLFITPRSVKGAPTGTRRGIGDRNDLTANPDGSLDLIIQHEVPAGGPSVNWLPAPTGAFTLSVRLHWPRPPALSGAWRMPAVERLGSGFARRAESRQSGTDPQRSPPSEDGLSPRLSSWSRFPLAFAILREITK